MKKTRLFVLFVCLSTFATVTFADTFGSGANQFTIDFVTISGDAGSANGTPAYITFSDPANDYRIGKYEVTDDQWKRYQGTSGTTLPVNFISWYQAAEFVNWLNTSTDHQPAYRITKNVFGSYAVDNWAPADAAGGTNLYRHKDAYYFLPSENEWIKAAYWNGISLQTWATDGNVSPAQNGWNYSNSNTLWNAGSGSVELNGTYDMMGNVAEWIESPATGYYTNQSDHPYRGGSCNTIINNLASTVRYSSPPYYNVIDTGFRVASVIPEPATLLLLAVGGMMLRTKK